MGANCQQTDWGARWELGLCIRSAQAEYEDGLFRISTETERKIDQPVTAPIIAPISYD